MKNQRSNERHPAAHIALPLVAISLAALALGACGGDEESAGTGASSSAGKGDDRAKLEQAALKHTECMRKEGIDLPDPKPGEGGVILRGPNGGGDPGAQLRATKKCDKYLRNVPPPKLSDDQKTEMRDSALKHARCMREEGLEFPDPRFDQHGGISVQIGDGFNPGDPRVRKAEQKCRRLLPQLGAGPPG